MALTMSYGRPQQGGKSRRLAQAEQGRARAEGETFRSQCWAWLKAHGWALLGLGATVVFLVAGVHAVRWAVHRPYFQIHRTVVTGALHQVDQALVAKMAQRIEGGLFTTDLVAAATELKSIPWVRSVHLRRVWPDTLEVQVEEQVPVAYWGDDDLLNTRGEVFAAEYLGNLPHFAGPRDTGPEVLQAWQRFNSILQPSGHRIEELTMSERGGWMLVLEDDSHWLLGRDQGAKRLSRLMAAWPVLRQDGAIPAGSTVDLRYPNGFAVHLPENDSQRKVSHDEK